MEEFNLYNHLQLNEGAYFYELGVKTITKKAIKDLFSDVLEGLDFATLYKTIKQEENVGKDGKDRALCSLLIFSYQSVPSFFDFDKDSFPKKLTERKIGYLLIVEIRNHVVIVKKNVSHLSSFLNNFVPIDAEVIAGVLVDNATDFQKMQLANINITKDAMRSKSYEANNLRISMPLFGVNQNIINSVRFVNSDGVCAVSVNTSRIAKFGEKKGLLLLIEWMNSMIYNIENYVPTDTFLSRFAKPQTWRSKGKELLPTAFLFNIFELENYIQTELNDKSIYRKIGRDDYKLWTDSFYRIFRKGSESVELTQFSDGIYLYKSVGVNKQVNGLRFYVSEPVKSLYYKDNNGKYLALSSLINSLHCYSVCFSDYSYIYSGGKLYNNTDIESDFDSILTILKPIDEISLVVSEKGSGYDEKSKDFSDNCIFNVVENCIFNDADILICDDMGNEWADHIALKENTLSFIHSKYKNEGLSASNFQDIIGQAIKNIGNMMPNEVELKNKIEKFKNSNWQGTGITKCRRGNIDDYEVAYKQLMQNPNKVREVCLVVNFISKEKLSKAFDKLKRKEPFKQRNSVIQLAWLLNGFISTCKQADLNCIIYCTK